MMKNKSFENIPRLREFRNQEESSRSLHQNWSRCQGDYSCFHLPRLLTISIATSRKLTWQDICDLLLPLPSTKHGSLLIQFSACQAQWK